jgi:nitroreductase
MQTEVIKNIKERRSIRNYEEKEIDKEILKKIIQTGKYAPSVRNNQPWKFIVITKKKLIKELSKQIKEELKKIIKYRFIIKFKIKELKKKEYLKSIFLVTFSKTDTIFHNAPVIILILTKNKLFYDQSCACCAQNMMLTAHSMGIGSCWIGYANVLGLNKKIIKKIGVPDDHHISAALIFGYPKDEIIKPSIRRIESDIIKWIE